MTYVLHYGLTLLWNYTCLPKRTTQIEGCLRVGYVKYTDWRVFQNRLSEEHKLKNVRENGTEYNMRNQDKQSNIRRRKVT